MEKEKKDNKGYLYTNTNKNKPKQPDMNGYIVFKGEEIKISGWKNVSADGKEYLSLMISTYDNNFQKDQSKDHKSTDDGKDKIENYTNKQIQSKDSAKQALMNRIVNDDINDINSILDSDDDPF